jgi:lysophospholipase L1-like esterase
MTQPVDDSLMSRFDRYGLRRFRARDAVRAVAIAAILLVLFEGGAIRRAADQADPSVGRDVLRAIGEPAGWIADRLPLARLADRATAWLSPDEELVAGADFGRSASGTAPAGVTAAAFDPAEIGAAPPPPRPLRRLLVTGDSLSTPLDIELARKLAGRDVEVLRAPHLGSAISKPFVVDWASLAATQERRMRPDAVVLFIGANEGFPLGDIRCCGADWAAAFATRVRRMTDIYRRGGAARVYWVTVPAPRDPARARIGRVVNAAIAVAIAPWRAHVRLVDAAATFTPAGYRDAMAIRGRQTIVRRADGIHLNTAGSALLADLVIARLGRDFTYGPEG